MPNLIGQLFGVSSETILLVMTFIEFVRSMFRWHLFDWNTNLEKVWHVPVPDGKFRSGEDFEYFVKFILSSLVILQSVIAPLYTLAYVPSLYTLITRSRPCLLLPWMVLSCFKHLILESSVIVITVIIWFSEQYDDRVHLLVAFLVEKIVMLGVFTGKWITIRIYYLKLKRIETIRKSALHHLTMNEADGLKIQKYTSIPNLEELFYQTPMVSESDLKTSRSLTILSSECGRSSFEEITDNGIDSERNSWCSILENPLLTPLEKTMKILGLTLKNISNFEITEEPPLKTVNEEILDEKYEDKAENGKIEEASKFEILPQNLKNCVCVGNSRDGDRTTAETEHFFERTIILRITETDLRNLTKLLNGFLKVFPPRGRHGAYLNGTSTRKFLGRLDNQFLSLPVKSRIEKLEYPVSKLPKKNSKIIKFEDFILLENLENFRKIRQVTVYKIDEYLPQKSNLGAEKSNARNTDRITQTEFQDTVVGTNLTGSSNVEKNPENEKSIGTQTEKLEAAEVEIHGKRVKTESRKIHDWGTVSLAEAAQCSGYQKPSFHSKPPVHPRSKSRLLTKSKEVLRKGSKSQDLQSISSNSRNIRKRRESLEESSEDKEMRALRAYNEVTLNLDKQELEIKRKRETNKVLRLSLMDDQFPPTSDVNFLDRYVSSGSYRKENETRGKKLTKYSQARKEVTQVISSNSSNKIEGPAKGRYLGRIDGREDIREPLIPNQPLDDEIQEGEFSNEPPEFVKIFNKDRNQSSVNDSFEEDQCLSEPTKRVDSRKNVDMSFRTNFTIYSDGILRNNNTKIEGNVSFLDSPADFYEIVSDSTVSLLNDAFHSRNVDFSNFQLGDILDRSTFQDLEIAIQEIMNSSVNSSMKFFSSISVDVIQPNTEVYFPSLREAANHFLGFSIIDDNDYFGTPDSRGTEDSSFTFSMDSEEVQGIHSLEKYHSSVHGNESFVKREKEEEEVEEEDEEENRKIFITSSFGISLDSSEDSFLKDSEETDLRTYLVTLKFLKAEKTRIERKITRIREKARKRFRNSELELIFPDKKGKETGKKKESTLSNPKIVTSKGTADSSNEFPVTRSNVENEANFFSMKEIVVILVFLKFVVEFLVKDVIEGFHVTKLSKSASFHSNENPETRTVIEEVEFTTEAAGNSTLEADLEDENEGDEGANDSKSNSRVKFDSYDSFNESDSKNFSKTSKEDVSLGGGSSMEDFGEHDTGGK